MSLRNIQRELSRLANRYQLTVWCEDVADDELGGTHGVFHALIEQVPPGSRHLPTHLHLSDPCDSLEAALTNLDIRLESHGKAVPR